MKKLLITLMLCLSCVTCFANEIAYERAKKGEMFIETTTDVVSGFTYDSEELDSLFTTMHRLGYIPHHSFTLSIRHGETCKVYITWMKTHNGGTANGL